MGKTFTITLNDLDLGQLLDGLRSRAESWRNTATYLETGVPPDEVFACEECSDSDEANAVAEHFEKIAADIEKQVKSQGGW